MKESGKEKELPRSSGRQLCQWISGLEGRESGPELAQQAFPGGEAPCCTLAEAIKDGLAMIDENMRITYVNGQFCQIVGYSHDELLGRFAAELYTEADQGILKEQIKQKRAGKHDHYEMAMVRKNGRKVCVLISLRPIFSAAGQFKGSLALITDITGHKQTEEKLLSTTQKLELRVQERTADLMKTNKDLHSEIVERERAEEELRKSKELFEKVFASQQDALFILDGSVPPKIIDCNPAATKVFGYSRQEMLDRTTNFLHEDEASLESFQDRIYPSIDERGFIHLPEFKMKRKDGASFPTEHTVTVLTDKQGERAGWVSVIRDITGKKRDEEERKELERRLLQAKKLEAISTLSGGVAQELGNLFQAVHGYVERLMWNKEKDDPKYQELLEITNAAFRGAVLSRRLLAFSGNIDSKKNPIDLNQEIEKACLLLRRTMPETIKIELQLAKGSTLINGDRNQIEQAILALAVNAREAMPDGGKIIVETKRMILDEDFHRAHLGAALGECVLITLSDTGPGLGQETLEQVFDPFYSRQKSTENTGLGLSMVYGIVKNHGGYISCSSQPNVGTTFKIYLPVTKEETD